MFRGRPIIGIVGGIGSGKSCVASLFRELGCMVIDSDRCIAQAYEQQNVQQTLVQWWGPGMLEAPGRVNRKAVADKVFANPAERQRLEGLLHPLASQMRDWQMASADTQTVAFVWDAPLLIEAGLASQCDAIVFVDAPEEVRIRRVMETRGWTREEWQRRENNQTPLDNKREIAKFVICNTAGLDEVRSQVRHVLSRIVAEIHGRERPKV
ncbi:MAG: dephospho-CoA kinase [Tepidisphaeraceae bacterium]